LPVFVKKLKDLARKYPSVKKDIEQLLVQLQQYPYTGTPLGKDCYKIRLAIKSKGQGKSGGARIITCVKIQYGAMYFLTIYDKSEQATASDRD
jgi:hypothetical protein